MTAKLIDGAAIGADVRREVTEQVTALKAQGGMVPNLSVVLVGDDPGSQSYVSSKGKGLHSSRHGFGHASSARDRQPG